MDEHKDTIILYIGKSTEFHDKWYIYIYWQWKYTTKRLRFLGLPLPSGVDNNIQQYIIICIFTRNIQYCYCCMLCIWISLRTETSDYRTSSIPQLRLCTDIHRLCGEHTPTRYCCVFIQCDSPNNIRIPILLLFEWKPTNCTVEFL